MKKIFFLFTLFITLTACQTHNTNSNSIVNNKSILQEIDNLEKTSLNRNLTYHDYDTLRELTKEDPVAQDEFKEIDWLTLHGEEEHASHSLGFLQSYAETGEKTPCFGHELSHIRLYIIHNDIPMAEDAIQELDVQSWITNAEQSRARFPQYYKNFDAIKTKALDTVERLKKTDYSPQTLAQIDYLEENAPC